MRIRRKLGRFRAVIAAVVVAVGGLAAVSASTQPAAAADSCTPSVQGVIPQWGTVQPNGPSGGITLCVGTTAGVPGTDAYLQIVDLSAGAKVRLIADTNNAICADPACDFATYPVKTAADWATWIPSHYSHPDGSRLYSVSNAAFFTNSSGSPTALSLPFVQFNRQSTGVDSFLFEDGFALKSSTTNNIDPSWDSPKRAITFGDQATTPQEVHMFDFPVSCSDPTCNHYTANDVTSAPFSEQPAGGTCLCDEWDAVVGFKPGFNGGAANARRTFVGVSQDGITGAITKVYILDTILNVSVSDAQNILESFGSQLELQFDGGNSTQLWGNGGAHLVDSPIGRGVPMVLAVYGNGISGGGTTGPPVHNCLVPPCP